MLRNLCLFSKNKTTALWLMLCLYDKVFSKQANLENELQIRYY